jgi:hypothetical protein
MGNLKMADIKRFTGFIAPDGTTHSSLTAATNYTNELKVKESLSQFAFAVATDDEDSTVSITSEGNNAVYVEDLPKFLLENRDAILAAFGQKATLRAPRGSKKKAVASKAPFVAAAPTVSIDAEMKAAGIIDLDE